MTESPRCPGCGAANEPDATACRECNFPLGDAPVPTAPPADPGPPAAGGTPPATAKTEEKPFSFDPGPRPPRRRARPKAMQPVQMQLWLLAAVAVVITIVVFAVKGFHQTNRPTVAGAQPDQQRFADQARQTLELDSTNVAARIDLANILFDTGNWGEAIVHYRSAARLDPERATTIVDMGVCYYNLSQFAAAESLFQHALKLDSRQVFAMFNLGIVAERQGRWKDAQTYYHRAMETGVPDQMRPVLEQHLQDVMQKTGANPPPLGR